MSNDRSALVELFRTSTMGVPHGVLHYLYFPTKRAAASVAGELGKRGFQTEERLGADGSNWLVLARHEVILNENTIASMRELMEALARQAAGEYDGWEAEVRKTL